jgi:hypothetical protein
MPKLGATGTKTDQLESVNLQAFRGFSRRPLVGVSARIALITQPSTKSVQQGLSQPLGMVDEYSKLWHHRCAMRTNQKMRGYLIDEAFVSCIVLSGIPRNY